MEFIRKLENIKIISIFLCIIPFLYGLFYEYTSCIVGIFYIIMLYKISIKNKQLNLCVSKNFILYTIIIISYLIVSIWAIDRENSIEGFLKFLPCIFYFILLMQFNEDEKKKIWNSVPVSGALMCIISIILEMLPFVDIRFFSENGRLIGFFQYSNTLSLFLLIGIIVIANKKDIIWKEKLFLAILIIGIVLTGSRITFLLASSFALYQICKRRKSKKQVLIISAIIITIIASSFFMLVVNKNENTLSRLTKISLNSSTLLGRVLYNLDGLNILINHPLGLGHMGYSYIYPEFQTGNYTTKFVHNDILQQGLDTGIIPMLVLIYLLAKNIFSKKSNNFKKELLIIIFLHMLFEFDIQFLIIDLILIMLFEQTDGKIVKYNANDKIIITTIAIILICIFSYFGVATFSDKNGKYDVSLELLPAKTNSNIQKMIDTQDLKEANKLADKILEKNKYISICYDIKATHSLELEEWKDMIYYKRKSIELNRYNIQKYEEMVLLISNALDKAINKEDDDSVKYLLEELEKVTNMLEDTKKNTNPLAYKLNDKPKFEMDENINNYMQRMNELIKIL